MERRARLRVLIAASLPALVAGQDGEAARRALAAAGTGAAAERTMLVLDDDQRRRIADEAGSPVPRVLFPYLLRASGEIVGVALFDTHRVRSQRETLLVTATTAPDVRVRRVDVVAFAEPRRYLAPPGYYARFAGSPRTGIDGIDGVSGATMTCAATIGAVRRTLAVAAHLVATGELARAAAADTELRSRALRARTAAGPALAARMDGAEVGDACVLLDQDAIAAVERAVGAKLHRDLVVQGLTMTWRGQQRAALVLTWRGGGSWACFVAGGARPTCIALAEGGVAPAQDLDPQASLVVADALGFDCVVAEGER